MAPTPTPHGDASEQIQRPPSVTVLFRRLPQLLSRGFALARSGFIFFFLLSFHREASTPPVGTREETDSGRVYFLRRDKAETLPCGTRCCVWCLSMRVCRRYCGTQRFLTYVLPSFYFLFWRSKSTARKWAQTVQECLLGKWVEGGKDTVGWGGGSDVLCSTLWRILEAVVVGA